MYNLKKHILYLVFKLIKKTYYPRYYPTFEKQSKNKSDQNKNLLKSQKCKLSS